MTNSADPDQLASSKANLSGSAVFAKTGHVVFSKRRVKGSPHICSVFLQRFLVVVVFFLFFFFFFY